MFKKIHSSVKGFEANAQQFLSKYPSVYAVLAAVSVILFWKGVTDIAGQYSFLSGPLLILVSFPIMVMLGLFLPFFVTDRTLLKKLNKEEKVVEREEIKEEKVLAELSDTIREMDQEIHEIQEKMHIRK